MDKSLENALLFNCFMNQKRLRTTGLADCPLWLIHTSQIMVNTWQMPHQEICLIQWIAIWVERQYFLAIFWVNSQNMFHNFDIIKCAVQLDMKGCTMLICLGFKAKLMAGDSVSIENIMFNLRFIYFNTWNPTRSNVFRLTLKFAGPSLLLKWNIIFKMLECVWHRSWKG